MTVIAVAANEGTWRSGINVSTRGRSTDVNNDVTTVAIVLDTIAGTTTRPTVVIAGMVMATVITGAIGTVVIMGTVVAIRIVVAIVTATVLPLPCGWMASASVTTTPAIVASVRQWQNCLLHHEFHPTVIPIAVRMQAAVELWQGRCRSKSTPDASAETDNRPITKTNGKAL